MTQVIELTKITFKKIEAEWFNYFNTKREIALIREEIMNPFQEKVDENIGGGRSNEVGKPTERIATRLSLNKQLNHLQDIVEAIDQVYEALPEEYQKLVKLRYWSKNRQLTWDGIALEIGISERQARRWRNEIVLATAEVLGWR